MSMPEGDRGRRSAAACIGDPPAMNAATAALAEARLDRFLTSEPVVWLSTVRPDGAPHLVPIWFTWDGTSLLVFSKPGAQKVRNLRANPVAMLALGEPEDDFDVALAEARGRARRRACDRTSRRTSSPSTRTEWRRSVCRPRSSSPRTRRCSGSRRRARCRGTAGRRREACLPWPRSRSRFPRWSAA